MCACGTFLRVTDNMYVRLVGKSVWNFYVCGNVLNGGGSLDDVGLPALHFIDTVNGYPSDQNKTCTFVCSVICCPSSK